MPPSAVSPGTEGLLSPSTQQPACEHTPERGTGPPGTYAHLQEPVASVRGTGPPEADCLPCHGHICHGGCSVFFRLFFSLSFLSSLSSFRPHGGRLGAGFLNARCCEPTRAHREQTGDWLPCRPVLSSLALKVFSLPPPTTLQVSILRRGVPVPPGRMLTCKNQSLR